ncbi:hypothetical protein K437DRAFT_259380 [Tilletiaria anomala UBC 951]|uniref:Acyl-CoA thioesterase-like N-terminal HotDog domain-containing protein n=1 Tax=Tilletiaria anomala (strain ATCC 24038 / CBS 436.72 / UBC 951) TaxID=1037660 RepID=A0A066V9U6_TILAU|nr:uncharacterized protein K437DRAFT_259380 [Tilletiaria anomala UBC 951]KDN38517.1 hypothetical protein K437DRAFT_259380 [Tilletiaria anomala UBC 951]
MGAFLQAVLSQLQRDGHDGTATYGGHSLDAEWSIGSIPQGGYSLSVILSAAMDFMRRPEQEQHEIKHHDPMHISASFLVATMCLQLYTVEIKLLKKGRGLSSLQATLTQPSYEDGKPVTRIHCIIIMCNFEERINDPTLKPTLRFGDPFYPSCPIPHIRTFKPSNRFKAKKMNMRDRMIGYDLPGYTERIMQENGNYQRVSWLEITNEMNDERLPVGRGATSLPFFADFGDNISLSIPGENRDAWLPTLHLAIEFKRAVPWDAPVMKVGLYSTSRHVYQGQNELDVEVYSHPDDAERLGLPQGQDSTILCISRQIALTLPLSVNLAQNKNKEKQSGDKAKM